jgi:DNA-binding CsgD family transcriptional regulator
MGDGDVCRLAVVDRRGLVRSGLRAMLAGEARLVVVAAVGEVEELRGRGGTLDVVAFGVPHLGDAHRLTAGVRALGAVPLAIDLLNTGPRAAGNPGSLPGDVDTEALRRAILISGGAARRPGAAAAAAPVQAVRLSRCEQQVLALYAAGAKAQTVATRLGVSGDTVNTYVRRVRQKYDRAGRPAASRIDLYRRAVEDGLVGDSAPSALTPAEVAIAV